MSRNEKNEKVMKKGEIVKTNLFEAMKTDENRKVLKKLAIFMLIEATIPIFLFFVMKNYVCPYFELSKKNTVIVSAGISLIAINVLIFLYVFLAFTEESSEKSVDKVLKKTN